MHEFAIRDNMNELRKVPVLQLQTARDSTSTFKSLVLETFD